MINLLDIFLVIMYSLYRRKVSRMATNTKTEGIITDKTMSFSRDELKSLIEDAFQAGFFAGVDEASGSLHVQDAQSYFEYTLMELGV
jgi:hypothetical protein